MSIDVRVPTILRSHTDGQKIVRGSGDTLADLLTDLDRQFPGIRAHLITEDGALHRFVNVYVNDEDVRFLGSLDAKLNPGDTVTILPAVAGGAPSPASVVTPTAPPPVPSPPILSPPTLSPPTPNRARHGQV